MLFTSRRHVEGKHSSISNTWSAVRCDRCRLPLQKLHGNDGKPHRAPHQHAAAELVGTVNSGMFQEQALALLNLY